MPSRFFQSFAESSKNFSLNPSEIDGARVSFAWGRLPEAALSFEYTQAPKAGARARHDNRLELLSPLVSAKLYPDDSVADSGSHL